jgi:thiol-disulfide isomerase/thioredoxin
MAETWILKTFDGEEYTLQTTGTSEDDSYDAVYNLFKGVSGHHGMPVSMVSDVVPKMAGAEPREVQRGVRTIQLPLWIRGKDPADFHRHLAKIRRSLRPEDEAQLWVMNEEGETRMIYCRYSKGFESLADDEARQLSWARVVISLECDDPYFYDPPGSELTRSILLDPFSAQFLQPNVYITNITEDVLINDDHLHVYSTAGFATDQTVEIVGGAQYVTGLINTATNPSTLTIKTLSSAGGSWATGQHVTVGKMSGNQFDAIISAYSSSSLTMGLSDVQYTPPGGLDLDDYFAADTPVMVTRGGFDDTCVVDSVDAVNHIITLKGYMRHEFISSAGAYVKVLDVTELFLTTENPEDRTLNAGCNYVVFWMRDCPPCYALLDQLEAMRQENPIITVTKVEIQDNHADDPTGAYGIGMDIAATLYPEAYAFACTCGPPLPAKYHALANIMPAVVTLYRGGIYMGGWCGVHTTQADPVSSDVLKDACGPRTKWRLSKNHLGDEIVINNTGDGVAYPVWTITGPGSNLHLENVTTGEDFLLVHDIKLGETVVVDSREDAHTCGSTNQADFAGIGYWANLECPTCNGAGVIPAECVNCGGWQACPTCHGTKTVRTWIASASGSTTQGALFNLRQKIAAGKRMFWGFDPGPNVIKVELNGADLDTTSVQFSLVRRYEGI